MIAAELLAKCRHLTLAEVDGKLAWIGTRFEWIEAEKAERRIISDFEFRRLWK